MVYYIIWPYDHRKATILTTHATIKDAYAALALLAVVTQPPSERFNPYIVDENHLPKDQLPPNQLQVGE